jgi:hypothetical protein
MRFLPLQAAMKRESGEDQLRPALPTAELYLQLKAVCNEFLTDSSRFVFWSEANQGRIPSQIGPVPLEAHDWD